MLTKQDLDKLADRLKEFQVETPDYIDGLKEMEEPPTPPSSLKSFDGTYSFPETPDMMSRDRSPSDDQIVLKSNIDNTLLYGTREELSASQYIKTILECDNVPPVIELNYGDEYLRCLCDFAKRYSKEKKNENLFQWFVEYPKTMEFVHELLLMADFLDIPPLFEICQYYIASQLIYSDSIKEIKRALAMDFALTEEEEKTILLNNYYKN
jgi:hypothetical protein